jgi:hypothetical protein
MYKDDMSTSRNSDSDTVASHRLNSKVLKTISQDNKIELHEDKKGKQYFTGPMGVVNVKVIIHSVEEALRFVNIGIEAKSTNKKNSNLDNLHK